MTERNTPERAETTDPHSNQTTMRAVDHGHPDGDGSVGPSFRRGPTVVADGGRRAGPGAERVDTAARRDRSAADRERPSTDRADSSTDADSEATMADVDHVPPHGPEINRIFERGGERASGVEIEDAESQEREDV